MSTTSSSPRRLPIIGSNHKLLIPCSLVVSLLLVSCGGAQRADRAPRGTLRFRGEPRDASLSIDETRLGPIYMFEKKGVLLLPGEHRVVIRAPLHFPEYHLVTVQANTTQIVEVKLRPIPD